MMMADTTAAAPAPMATEEVHEAPWLMIWQKKDAVVLCRGCGDDDTHVYLHDTHPVYALKHGDILEMRWPNGATSSHSVHCYADKCHFISVDYNKEVIRLPLRNLSRKSRARLLTGTADEQMGIFGTSGSSSSGSTFIQ